MKSSFLLVLGMLVSMTVNAAGSSGTALAGSIIVDSGEELIAISTSSAWSNPDGCAASAFVAIPMSNPHYKDLLATVLAAHAARNTVDFWVDGCVWTPWGVSPRVVTVSVYD